MNVRLPVWALMVVAVGLSGRPASAQGQTATGSAGYQPQQPLAVPIAAAGMNPYMNPYFMGSQGNSDYLLYLYAQNQRNGGIGTGVISGARPAPGAPIGATVQGRRPINEATPYGNRQSPGTQSAPSRRTALLPAEVTSSGIVNTGGYFQRGPGISGGAGRYFNRTQPVRPQNNGR